MSSICVYSSIPVPTPPSHYLIFLIPIPSTLFPICSLPRRSHVSPSQGGSCISLMVCHPGSGLSNSVLFLFLVPFICVHISCCNSFLQLSNTSLCKWFLYIFFMHSSGDVHLGCFQVLYIMNNAAINKVMQVSSWYNWVSFGYMLRNEIDKFPGRTFGVKYVYYHIFFKKWKFDFLISNLYPLILPSCYYSR